MGPGGWDWQSNNRGIASGGHNVGDIVNGWRWDGVQWTAERGTNTSGGGGGSVPSFKFDWEAARKAAFDPEHPENSVLGRYYLQKLKDAGDDVARAKRLLQEDYDRGVRIAQEDYSVETRRAEEDYGQDTAEEKIRAQEETRSTIGSANQRGVLFGEMERGQESPQAPVSQYAKGFLLQPMEDSQKLRSQAIERALQRQKELSTIDRQRTIEGETITKTRGVEEANIQYPRTQQALQEETRDKAYNTAVPMRYNEEYQKFTASQGQ